MRELLYIVAVNMSPLLALLSFTTWWSAAMFTSAIGLLAVIAVRHHEKHHRSEVYDDRLSSERIEKAREWLLENTN